MPIFEMPISELERYQGSSPKPDDFDEYWAAALRELEETDAKIELRVADFQTSFAECFDLYFSGVRGARIHAIYLRPRRVETPHPAVLKFHGYGANAGDWYHNLGYAAAGYSVVAMDCRGQGGSSDDSGGVTGTTFHGHIIRGLDDAPDKLLFRHIYLDTVQLARIVMSFSEVAPERVGVTGASQGGGLSLACAGLEPRLKRVAPIYPFLCDFRRTWQMDLAKDAYGELATFFRVYDPLHQREDDIFRRLGYIDTQFLAERIKGQVLFTTGMMDTVCPPSTQFAAYNRIQSPKDMIIYPDYGHEELPGATDRSYRFFSEL